MEPKKNTRGAPKGHFGNVAFDPEPHRENVKAWARIASRETISAYLGISLDSLDKYFKAELREGRFDAVTTVGGKLLEKALKGDRTCMIFYLRTQGKWNTRVELTGPDGGPMRHIDLSKFLEGKTEEELAQIEPLIEQLMSASSDPDEPGNAG